MGARTGEQFLDKLRKTRPHGVARRRARRRRHGAPGAGGRREDAGGRVRPPAPVCRRVPDRRPGDGRAGRHQPHDSPLRSRTSKRRNRGLTRISEATVGLMGRTPDYMNVKFACFAARHGVWAGADHGNEEGAREPGPVPAAPGPRGLSLTHTIIQPTIDKVTDARIVGNQVTLHKVGETATGIVVRGARILATLAPFADEIAVYPGLPIPAEATAYALAFAIPVDTPGTDLPVPGQRRRSGRAPLRPPAVLPIRRAGRLRHLRQRRGAPRPRVHRRPRGHLQRASAQTGIVENLTNQTTIRALTKLEFAYGLATRMAEAVNDQSPATQEMLGELLSYVEVTRSAVLLSAEHGRHVGDGVWFPDPRPLVPDALAARRVVPARRRDHHAHRQPQPAGHAEPPAARRPRAAPAARRVSPRRQRGRRRGSGRPCSGSPGTSWAPGSRGAEPALRALLPHLGEPQPHHRARDQYRPQPGRTRSSTASSPRARRAST